MKHPLKIVRYLGSNKASLLPENLLEEERLPSISDYPQMKINFPHIFQSCPPDFSLSPTLVLLHTLQVQTASQRRYVDLIYPVLFLDLHSISGIYISHKSHLVCYITLTTAYVTSAHVARIASSLRWATSAGNSQVEMKQTASAAASVPAAVSSSDAATTVAAAISRNSRFSINHSLRYGVWEQGEDADGQTEGMTGGGTNNITRAKDGPGKWRARRLFCGRVLG